MDLKDIAKINAARKRFDDVSETARQEIYAKVLEHYKRHPGSPWSGAPLRDLEKTIRQFYSDLGLRYKKAFRDTLPPIMQTYYDRAVEEMKKAGVRNAVLGKPDSGRIRYFLDNSFQQVAMKTTNMSFQHIRSLRRITADVTRQMSIAGAARREVSKALLNRAMEIPGFEFIDKDGTKWAEKSYFDMLARTELMNAARASYDDKCAEEGFDVMRLTTSGNSCDHCSKYEGKLFSLTGATPGIPSKQDLMDDGVFHPNCTHSYSLVPKYIAEKYYNGDGSPKNRAFDGSEVKNLSEYSRIWDGAFDDVPKEQFEGLEAYTQFPGTAINEYLRFGEGSLCDMWGKQKLKKWAENTSKIFDTVKNKSDVIVYRCVDDFSFLPEEGAFTEKGFCSCSTRPNMLFGSKIMEIQVPKGARGGFVGSVSYLPNENEFLIDKNTKYDILYTKKVKINGEKHDCVVLRVKNGAEANQR